MDSDEEDVSDNEILQWYSERVEEIWDSATDSAFSDLSANLTDMFRQVMNNVKQRNQGQANGHIPNGHDSTTGATVNGHSSTEDGPSTSTASAANNVVMSSDQLMELLQDDDEWLDDNTATGGQEDEEMMLSVQLTDSERQAEPQDQDQKNVKGVSQGEIKTFFLADSVLTFQCLKMVLVFVYKIFKTLLFLLVLTLIIYLAALLCSPIQKVFMRNMQNYIYPSMRLLRLWTLPLVHHFPWLTDYHEETCLVRNPLYWQRELDCWSCRTPLVETFDSGCISDFSSKFYHSGTPLLIRESTESVTVDDIVQLHSSNPRQFGQGIGGFTAATTISFYNISDFLGRFDSRQFRYWDEAGQVSWKINRVATLRLFRRLFPRPQFIPRETEVGLQKYLFVDGPRTPPYKLPTTEFANVWVQQGSGSRQIRLIPSPSCQSACSSVNITLGPGDILYYNWQFWNPESWPAARFKDLSLTYVGSFY